MSKNDEAFKDARYLDSNSDEYYNEELQELADGEINNYNSEPVEELFASNNHSTSPIQKLNNAQKSLPKFPNKNKTDNLGNSKNNGLNNRNFNQFNTGKNANESLQNKLNQNRINYNNRLNNQHINEKAEDNSEDNQSGKKNKSNLIKQKVAKEALKKVGVPSFAADLLSKKTNKSTGGKEKIDSADLEINLPSIGLGLIVIVISVVLFCVIAATSFQDDESEVSSSKTVNNYITGNETEENLTQELVYLNVCQSNDDKDVEIQKCLNSTAGKYFTHLRDLYNTYKEYEDRNGNPIELNVGLILETISYNISDIDLFADENLENITSKADALAEAQVEHYQEIGDLYIATGNVCTKALDEIVIGVDSEESYYRISTEKYNSYLLYGKVHENYNNEIKVYDVDIHPDSDSDCIPEGRMYKSISENSESINYDGNIKDGYISLNINADNNKTDEELKINNEKVLKEIYKRAKVNYGTVAYSNVTCPGVMVTGDHAGVYSLEDYIAGVIQNENHWYEGDNIENMKAQAVAARTYALRLTANCTLPIENSTAKQTFNPNTSEQSKKAAQETAGQVLVDDSGDYISTEYDALAVKQVTSSHYILKQADLQIPVSWINSKISSSSLEYYANHNHGRGMSQWGSRYLQTQGYSYDRILSTFYTSGKLTTLGSSVTNNIPSSVNDLVGRHYFTFDMNVYRGNTLFAQCVWYAKHRAMEILATSTLDPNTKQILINSINNTGGNGQDWFRTPDPKYFKKSSNINEPKAGSIVSWTRGQYGHVAIVEAVFTNEKGETMVTLTEGWRQKGSDGNWYITDDLWSVTRFSRKNLTLAQLQTYSGSFNGYVYLY